MSKAKTKTSKESPRSAFVPKMARPKGSTPMAVVTVRHGGGMISRSGRGFSIGEIAAVELTDGTARELGLKVDPFRRSSLEGNVSMLRSWYQKPAKKVKAVEKPETTKPEPEKKPAPVKKKRSKAKAT